MKNSCRYLLAVALYSFGQDGVASADVPSRLPAPITHRDGQHGMSPSQGMSELTLGEAVHLGLRNNRNIRSAHVQRIAQKFDLRVAEDTFSPKLLLSANYMGTTGSDNVSDRITFSPTASLLGPHGTRVSMGLARELNGDRAGRFRSDGLDLSIIQPLLRGAGKKVTTAPLQMARISDEINRLDLKAAVSDVIFEIVTSYRELLKAQEQLGIVSEALDRANSLLDVNRSLIDAGRMAEFEIVQTQADIAALEMQVEEARNQVDMARLSLLRLLALDLSTPIRANEVLEAFQVNMSKEDALRTAQARQPRYLSMLLGNEVAELNLIAAKDQTRWDVSLVAGANQVRTRSTTEAEGARIWDRYIGLQIEVPLGDLAVRQSEVNARVNMETQRIAADDAAQELERNVSDVLREIETYWRQYEIAKRAVDLSKLKLDIEREKLSAGRSANFQVISFEADLREAEGARLGALISYLNAQVRLDLVLGTILESWEISLNDAK